MKFSINEAQENIIGDFAMCLLNAVTAAHIHHFGTESYAQHVALREFYENFEDLADKFIEAYQGKKSMVIASALCHLNLRSEHVVRVSMADFSFLYSTESSFFISS